MRTRFPASWRRCLWMTILRKLDLVRSRNAHSAQSGIACPFTVTHARISCARTSGHCRLQTGAATQDDRRYLVIQKPKKTRTVGHRVSAISV